MNIKCTLEKTTKNGVSTWYFVETNTSFFGVNNEGKSIICRDVDEMRGLYRRMVGYGYTSPTV